MRYFKRMIYPVALAGLFGWLTAAAAQTSTLPPLLARAVASTQAAKSNYVFDVEYRSADLGWRAHFDPSNSPGLRLIDPKRDALHGDVGRDFDMMANGMHGVYWCASADFAEAQNVRLSHEDAASATYAFHPPPLMTRAVQGQPPPHERNVEAENAMQGEVTVDKQSGDVTQLRLFSTVPFHPISIVQVDHMTISVSCAVAPNGRTYAKDTATEVHASMFLKSLDQNSVRHVSNLVAGR